MPVNYTIVSALNLLYYAALDECTGPQFIKAAREATKDERYCPNMLVIYDLLAMTDVNFDTSLFHQGAVHLQELQTASISAAKTAVISRSKFADNFLSTLELLATDVTFHWQVFPDVLWALPWLGLADVTAEVFELRDRLVSTGTRVFD